MGNKVEDFLYFQDLCLSYGYEEININLGCPFSLVTGRGLGAGLLDKPDELNNLLTNIFSVSKCSISLKTRLGNLDFDEFEKLIPIFNNFPILEIIIHPRIAKQMYGGEVNITKFKEYYTKLNAPVIYNGDIDNFIQYTNIKAQCSDIKGVMIGRGVLKRFKFIRQN
ncbi:MAG: tRNA-dihydrouridine synthase family protein [Bacteroidales bacterium]|nr:tRNA-dihydrouridine synthase family protein [Bacteroidales bacterium]